MVSGYSYPEYFYRKLEKDILIVDSGATVTIVPGEPPTVSDATVEIHTKDLKLESFQLDECLCSEDNLKFGLCEASKVEFTIENRHDIPNLKSTNYTKLLKIYIYFEGDSLTLFQVGQYMCYSDEYSADRSIRNIECYDLLYYLRDEDITAWYYGVFDTPEKVETIGNLRASLFTWLYTEAEYPILQEAKILVNDGMTIGRTIESDNITFEFFMQGILEANGVFGHIGRTGVFEYKQLAWYDTPSVQTITDDYRKPPTQYKDYTTWGIGYVDVYDENNLLIAHVGSTNKRYPSIYTIADNFVFKDILKRNIGGTILNTALTNLREVITHLRYKPCEVECMGNPWLEVGDKINVEYDKDGDGETETFYTYILERHLQGLNSMLDTYTANGDKKQPKFQSNKQNDNWHVGENSESGTATSGEGTGGISEVINTNMSDMIEYWRNIGIRLLDEPTNASCEYVRNNGNHWVELMWTDPNDISNNQPVSVAWLGTVVIRKEDSAPKHRWDGTLIVNSTTRNAYSETPLVDSTIQDNKRYYYGIFPYHRHLTDSDNNINFYRPTKVFSVNTAVHLVAPDISNLAVDGLDVTVTYEVPTLSYGTYNDCRLVVKKNGIPNTSDDGTVIPLDPTQTSKVVSGLDENSTYFFMIYVEDSEGNTASSEPQDITTGTITTKTLKNILKTTDFTHIKDYRGGYDIPSEELGTDWLFMTGQTYGRLPSWDNTNEIWYANNDPDHNQYVGGHAFVPIKPCYIYKAKFDLKFTTSTDGNPFAFYVKAINGNSLTTTGTLYALVTQSVDITNYEVTFNPPIRADYFEVYCGGSSADIIYQISNMTLEVIEI